MAENIQDGDNSTFTSSQEADAARTEDQWAAMPLEVLRLKAATVVGAAGTVPELAARMFQHYHPHTHSRLHVIRKGKEHILPLTTRSPSLLRATSIEENR